MFKRKKDKKQDTPRQRRNVVTSDSRPVSSSYSYRTSRSEDQDNTGRDTSRESDSKAKSKAPTSFKRLILSRIGLIVLVAALVFSAINIISLSKDVRVVSLSSDSANTLLHTQSGYQEAARDLLAKSAWNNNKITVNANEINQELLKKFPELSSANLTLPLLSKNPVLYVESSEPALIINTPEGSFVVDSKGKALVNVEGLPDVTALGLPRVTDQSGIKVELNKQVLTSDNINFIKTVAAQLAAKNKSVSTMTLPVATSELDVTVVGESYTIKYNLRTNDARQQTGTYLATVTKLQKQNITPAEYVDVRVNGRAYYK